jgi:hypothetical protein
MSSRTLVPVAFLLLLFFTTVKSYAQSEIEDIKLPPVTFDSTYITDYTGLLTTRIYLLYQNASLLINPADDKLSRIVYRPNVNVRIGIAGFWRWFGLGLSINNPVYKTDRQVYGKTTTLDLRVNAFGRYVAGEFFFQQYKGFYISTPERSDGTLYLVPDMKVFSLGISGYWIYNAERFSIRAAFIQNERQRRSAGSLVVRPAFLYYRISSDHGIIPPDIEDVFRVPKVNLVTFAKIYTVGISPGYAYSFVFLKNVYVTGAVFPGVAAKFSTLSNGIKVQNDFEFVFQLGGRFALGYNSDKWFIGGSVQAGFNEIPAWLSGTLLSYDVAQIRFWVGTRLDLFNRKRKVPSGY